MVHSVWTITKLLTVPLQEAKINSQTRPRSKERPLWLLGLLMQMLGHHQRSNRKSPRVPTWFRTIGRPFRISLGLTRRKESMLVIAVQTFRLWGMHNSNSFWWRTLLLPSKWSMGLLILRVEDKQTAALLVESINMLLNSSRKLRTHISQKMPKAAKVSHWQT